MSIRFIHTGDWHLGKTFGTLPEGLSGELSSARFDAISRIADIARQRHATHVLVAGDVFDGPDIARVDLRRAMSLMSESGGLSWWLLPGNHDPAKAGGVWSRLRRIGLASNVTIVDQAQPVSLADDVTLLPAPLTSHNPGFDPTAWMTASAMPGDGIRIGLAHGSVQGFGSEGESAVFIAADRAKQSGLDYLALGDWHGTKKIDARTWYAGTPEPDRFSDNAPGHVLVVSVERGGQVAVEQVASRAFTWAKAEATIASMSDVVALEPIIAAMSANQRTLLLSLSLAGNVSLREHDAIAQWAEQWAARLKWLDVRTPRLAIRPAANDFELLQVSPALMIAAKKLSATADDATADPALRTAATVALVKLFGFAAEAAADIGSDARTINSDEAAR